MPKSKQRKKHKEKVQTWKNETTHKKRVAQNKISELMKNFKQQNTINQ